MSAVTARGPARPSAGWVWSPWGRLLASGLAAMLALAAWRAWAWWASPEHRIAQFVSAVNRRDWHAMIARASASEVREGGLTPEKLRVPLEERAWGAGPGWQLTSPKPFRLMPAQRRYMRGAFYAIPGRRAPEPNKWASATAYNTDGGWKIGLTDFVWSVLRRQEHLRRSLIAGVRPGTFVPQMAAWADYDPDGSAPGGRPAQ